MNYYLKKEENSDLWKVIERPTDQIIKRNLSHKEARQLVRHFNLGGGFDSWTPSFLLSDFSSFINKGTEKTCNTYYREV